MMKPFQKPVRLTRPLLPSLVAYTRLLAKPWKSKWLTNGGPYVEKLEQKVQKMLHVSHSSLFSSGTTALMVAIRALKLTGEVITTPFTFPATVHALTWMGLTPVFCDIDPITMNIDVRKIEALISPRTSALLPVHVFGTPCDVAAIDAIAKRRKLKVLYDAAHAFGVEVDGRGIGTFGDMTMFSFHATKLFHTAEGGCLTWNEKTMNEEIELLKNFGIRNEEEVTLPGINGKMSEIHAALGLSVAPLIKSEIRKRQLLDQTYRQFLKHLPAGAFTPRMAHVRYNFQYFAIRIDEELSGTSRDAVYKRLCSYRVFARKYFYPLRSNLPHYKDIASAHSSQLPVANKAAREVLCLPLHGDLTPRDIQKICQLIQHRP